jgi:hypothetical protein
MGFRSLKNDLNPFCWLDEQTSPFGDLTAPGLLLTAHFKKSFSSPKRCVLALR